MKKYMSIAVMSLLLSTSFISCKETKQAVDATGDAVEEGIDEVGENTGISDEDDL